MDSAGYKNLGIVSITGSETIEGDWVDIEGALSCLISLRLSYGSSSGSPSVKAYVQTMLEDDEDGIVCDVACVLFETASEHKVLNLSALTPKTTQVTPTDKALSNDTCVDGVLGNKVRLAVVVLGTYSGSTQLVAGVVVR